VENATQTLHRLTSYEPGRERDEPVDDPRVSLPRDLPSTTAPAVAVLAGTAAVAPAELDLPQLSRSLHLSAGVVRATVRPYAT